MSILLRPVSLIVFSVAGFLFFLAIDRMSKSK